MFLTFLLNIKRFGQLGIILILVVLTLYLNARVIYLKNQQIECKMVTLKSQALYEEQLRINAANEKEAEEYKSKYLEDQKTLNRAVVPEDCEAALEWAIRYLNQSN